MCELYVHAYDGMQENVQLFPLEEGSDISLALAAFLWFKLSPWLLQVMDLTEPIHTAWPSQQDLVLVSHS